MSIRLVVKIQHVTLRVQLRGVCTVVSDSIDVGKSLHAELAVESTAQRIEDLVLFLRPVPHCMIS
jgi:hypothetical protein